MKKFLMKQFPVDEAGAKRTSKAIWGTTIVNITLMFPAMVLFYFLLQSLPPMLKGLPAYIPELLTFLIIGIVVLAIRFVVEYVNYNLCYTNVYNTSETTRIEAAEAVRKLPLSFFGKRDLSDTTIVIMSDVTGIEQGLSHYIPSLIGGFITVGAVAVMSFIFDWRMALALFWTVPVAFVGLYLMKKSIDNHFSETMATRRVYADSIQEAVENVREIKMNGMEDRYLNMLNGKFEAHEKRVVKAEVSNGIGITALQFTMKVGMATCILAGTVLFCAGKIDFMVLLGFLILGSMVFDSLSTTMVNLVAIFQTFLQGKRLKELFEYPVQTGTTDAPYSGYDITFDHVDFSYNEGDVVLKDVSFTAKQGEVTALVGPSGSGKSTAAKLAARFWDPSGGKITLGGTDITTVDPETYLKNFSIVFQDVVLFDNSVMENIRIGRKDATDEDVLRVAKLAMCDGFVSKMPNGYNTMIGENGSKLSGGERQRISIARALLKDAPVILLDEATASLDADNETEVQKAISELVRDKTVLVIAHRLRTVSKADKIVVLKDGSVAEQGAPDDLLEKDGLFKHLYTVQKQSFDWSLN